MEQQSTEAQDTIRARLLRGQTCSSVPDVGAGAELALAMGDDESSCIAAFRCFLAFFLAVLLICNTCSQFKKGHWIKCRAASDDLVIRYMDLDNVNRLQ